MFITDLKISEVADSVKEDLIFDASYETPHKSDYAIVLGGPYLSCVIRADIAALFYKNKYTRKLIVSGGVCRNGKAECDIMRARLIDQGIPSDSIILENRATDTIENIVCSLDMICKSCAIMKDVESVTVITEPYHIVRSVYMAKLLLPSFIRVYGYTVGVDMQRRVWKSDFANSVNENFRLLYEYCVAKKIPNIRLDKAERL